MKIRDLKEKYPKIYDAAIRLSPRVRKDGSIATLCWSKADFTISSPYRPEDFWYAVHKGDFNTAKRIAPIMFEKAEKEERPVIIYTQKGDIKYVHLTMPGAYHDIKEYLHIKGEVYYNGYSLTYKGKAYSPMELYSRPFDFDKAYITRLGVLLGKLCSGNIESHIGVQARYGLGEFVNGKLIRNIAYANGELLYTLRDLRTHKEIVVSEKFIDDPQKPTQEETPMKPLNIENRTFVNDSDTSEYALHDFVARIEDLRKTEKSLMEALETVGGKSVKIEDKLSTVRHNILKWVDIMEASDSE